MLEVRPTRDNPIYQEWRKWRHICDENYTPWAAAAKDSIERIAEHIYEGKCHCIVGAMIMMDDTQTEEERAECSTSFRSLVRRE